MRHLLLISAVLLSSLESIGDCYFPEIYLNPGHKGDAQPVLPDYAGGTSTAANPQINLKYDSCRLGFPVKKDPMVLSDPASDSYPKTYFIGGFTYEAKQELNEDVCTNKCAYGISVNEYAIDPRCPNNTVPSTDINGGKCMLPAGTTLSRCAPDVTMMYLKLCAPSTGTNQPPKAFGICGYRSNFWNIDGLGNHVLLGCFPAAAHPLPPAFCHWDASAVISPVAPDNIPQPQFLNPTIAFCDASTPNCMMISASNLGQFYNPPDATKKSCTIKQLPIPLPPLGTPITVTDSDCPPTLKIDRFKCVDSSDTPAVIYEDNYKLCLYGAPVDPNHIAASYINTIPRACQADDPGIGTCTNASSCTCSVGNPNICVPKCNPDNQNKECALCDKRLCLDMYPFKFDCSKIDSSDNGTIDECNNYIQNFCLARKDNNIEYLNFDRCIASRRYCDKNPGSAIKFDDKKHWLCKTVIKVLPGFDSGYCRYDIKP